MEPGYAPAWPVKMILNTTSVNIARFVGKQWGTSPMVQWKRYVPSLGFGRTQENGSFIRLAWAASRR